jgi:hypothetical protein
VGTAAAVRALLDLGSGTREVASSLVVRVNGREAARVAVDPADPFLSAASLRHVDLTALLAPGANEVEVAYDGALRASVVLETRQWGLAPPPPAEALALAREAPAAVSLQEPFPVTILLRAKGTVPFVVVEESIPANAEVDEGFLEGLRKSGAVADFRVDGSTLRLYFFKVEGERKLTYRLVATAPGTSKPAGAVAWAMHDPAIRASAAGGDLEVKP